MVEMYNSRLKFAPGMQSVFIKKCIEELGISNKEVSRLLKVNVRTLTDWKREKFLITNNAAHTLSKISKTNLPSIIEKRDAFWYVRIGARKGGLSSYKKYGHVGCDPTLRKIKWREWWDKIGRLRLDEISIFARKPISTPSKNPQLAELVGIIIGDGGITQHQLSITLNRETDHEYALYTLNLIQRLFNVKPSVYESKKDLSIDIVVSRTELVDYLKNLGLKVGSKIKNKLDIPVWIKKNPIFIKRCLRGLIDTDGCLIRHCYKVNGKKYCYKKLAFTSRSPIILKSTYNIFKSFGFTPRITHDGKDIRIDSCREVARYFKIIGFRNPKHTRNFIHWEECVER